VLVVDTHICEKESESEDGVRVGQSWFRSGNLLFRKVQIQLCNRYI